LFAEGFQSLADGVPPDPEPLLEIVLGREPPSGLVVALGDLVCQLFGQSSVSPGRHEHYRPLRARIGGLPVEP
jgi:hypothetical protein